MPDLPLNALRAFEVAARTGAFTLAAAELGVTSAAVSQQVKALESHYGKKLFLRQGNRITLSDAGRAIYPRLEAALAEIAAVGAVLSEEQGRSRLVVSCVPTVAESWLIPRLAGFGAAQGIELRVEEDPVNLARTGIDLRITYGSFLYPDHRCEPLFRDRIVAVARPERTQDGLAALPDRAFIHTDWGQSFLTAPSWAAYWRQAGGRAAPDPAARRRQRTDRARCPHPGPGSPGAGPACTGPGAGRAQDCGTRDRCGRTHSEVQHRDWRRHARHRGR